MTDESQKNALVRDEPFFDQVIAFGEAEELLTAEQIDDFYRQLRQAADKRVRQAAADVISFTPFEARREMVQLRKELDEILQVASGNDLGAAAEILARYGVTETLSQRDQFQQEAIELIKGVWDLCGQGYINDLAAMPLRILQLLREKAELATKVCQQLHLRDEVVRIRQQELNRALNTQVTLALISVIYQEKVTAIDVEGLKALAEYAKRNPERALKVGREFSRQLALSFGATERATTWFVELCLESFASLLQVINISGLQISQLKELLVINDKDMKSEELARQKQREKELRRDRSTKLTTGEEYEVNFVAKRLEIADTYHQVQMIENLYADESRRWILFLVWDHFTQNNLWAENDFGELFQLLDPRITVFFLTLEQVEVMQGEIIIGLPVCDLALKNIFQQISSLHRQWRELLGDKLIELDPD